MADAEAIINEARDYAARSFNQAKDYIGQAVAAAYGMAQSVTPILPDAETRLEPLTFDTLPGFSDHYRAPLNTAVPPQFQTLWVPDLPAFPAAPATLDTSGLFRQARPVYDLAPFAESPPVVKTDFTYPAPPVLSFPDAPVPHAIALDSVPAVAIPAFEARFDGVEPALPDPAGAFRLEYQRLLPVLRCWVDQGVEDWIGRYAPQLTAGREKLEARLNRDLDGGYALSDAAELALFDRQRDRIAAEAAANQQQVLGAAGRRGWAMPQAAVAAALLEVDLAAGDRVAAAATEVAIERAKIELQHVQFCMSLLAQLSQSLQGLMLQYAGVLLQINGQAVEQSRTLAGLLVEAFNAGLRLYQAKLELYRTAAAVYETELKAALAVFDGYRLELEAAQLTVQIDAQAVALYQARLQGERERIDAYLAELQAIKQMADTERLKVELFGEQVKAYTALVGAKQSEFECYKAAIGGDAARVEAYSTEVAAYRASVEALGETAKLQIARNEAVAAQNRNLVAQYEAELEAFKSEVGAESARFEGAVRRNAALLEAYRTKLEGQVQDLRLRFEQARLDLEATQTVFRGDLETRLSNAKLILDGVQIAAQASLGAGKVIGDIASAAVSATNTMATVEQSAA